MTGLKSGHLSLVTDEQVTELHEAALHVLENKGIQIESEGALDLLAEKGAAVDRDTQVATFPRSLVEETIDTAPAEIVLGAQEQANDRTLSPDTAVFSPGTGVTSVRDIETGEKRKPTTTDISQAVRLSDSLEHIDISWGFFTMPDDPMLGFHNLYSLLTESTKHGGIVNWYGGDLTEKLIEMIEIASDRPIGERPLVTMYSEPVSPLTFRSENMESILQWTDASLPLIWYPAQKPGATAPVTLEGSFVQALAETLGGNTIAQLNNPGTPVIIGISPLVMNLQTGINVYYSPEMLVLQTAAGRIGDMYDIPVFGTGGCTNAYSLDFQAGMESALSLYGAVLGGQNFIHDLGFAGRGDVGSLELLTLTDEMIGMLEHAVEGMTTTEESLALDVIENVDHGDNFLAEPHTKQFGREELFLPDLLDAVEGSAWTHDKAVAKAREKTARVLESEPKQPVSEETVSELQTTMDAAETLVDELDTL